MPPGPRGEIFRRRSVEDLVPEVPSGDFAAPGKRRGPRNRKDRRSAGVRPARPAVYVRRRDLSDVPRSPRRRGRGKTAAQAVPAQRITLHRLPQEAGYGRSHPARSAGDRREQRMRTVPPAPRRGAPVDVGTGKGNGRNRGGVVPGLPPRGKGEGAGVASSHRGTSDELHGVPAAAGPVSEDRSRRRDVPRRGGLLPDVPRRPRKRHHAGRSGCRETPATVSGGRIGRYPECGNLLEMPPREGGEARYGGLPLMPPPPLGRGARCVVPEVPSRRRRGAVRSPPEGREGVRFLSQGSRKRHERGKKGGTVLRMPSRHPEDTGDSSCFAGGGRLRDLPSRPPRLPRDRRPPEARGGNFPARPALPSVPP